MPRAAIRKFILDTFLFGGDPEQLQNGASLLESQILDSTGVMELVVWLEQQFGIAVEDSEVVPENIDTVDSICEYLQRKGVVAGVS